MSPNAREKFRTYERTAQLSQAEGRTGIPEQRYENMKVAMSAAGYKDAGAAQAIEALHGQKGEISGHVSHPILSRHST